MPASAPHAFGDEHAAPVADVIDFASRRAAQRRQEPCAPLAAGRPTDEEIAAAEAWQAALAKHGASLDDPVVRAALAGVADLMERMVIGARRLRESGADEGLDEVGARLMANLVADLRGTAATVDALRETAEEC
ncbi:hypothetical protein [Kitasatospora sp. NPDC004272]